MTRTQILKIFIVRSSEQERVRGAEIFKIRVFNLQEHACEVEYEIVRESRTPLPPPLPRLYRPISHPIIFVTYV